MTDVLKHDCECIACDGIGDHACVECSTCHGLGRDASLPCTACDMETLFAEIGGNHPYALNAYHRVAMRLCSLALENDELRAEHSSLSQCFIEDQNQLAELTKERDALREQLHVTSPRTEPTRAPWRPNVGDWVRVIESGHVARVHSTEPNGYGELGGVRLEPGELQKRRRQLWFDARLLEKWMPRPTDRVCHHATKAEGTVLRIDGGKAWIIEWATYCGLAFLQPVVI